MHIYDIIEELRNEPGKLKKEAILKSLSEQDAELFKTIAFQTYNPNANYYIKKIPEYTESGVCEIGLDADPQGLLDALSSREASGNNAITLVESYLTMLTPKSQKVLELILSRSLDCGVSEKTINKVWKGLIPTFGVMLCSPLNDKTKKRIKWPAITQVKYDASRCTAIVQGDEVTFKTRNGKVMAIENDAFKTEVIELAAVYGRDVTIDGEIMIANANRQDSNRIVTKLVRDTATSEEVENIHFKVWDIVPLEAFIKGAYDAPYVDRLETLREVYGDATKKESGYNLKMNHVTLAETRITKDFDEAYAWCLELMAIGEEGVIIKNSDGPWKNKRSTDQFKVKLICESDMKITKLVYGTGKYADALGAIECESSDGLVTVSVGTGLTDEDRRETYHPTTEDEWIGKIMVVRHNGLVTDNKGQHSLYLPRFIEVRLDKDEADNIEKIKAEVNIDV